MTKHSITKTEAQEKMDIVEDSTQEAFVRALKEGMVVGNVQKKLSNGANIYK